MGIDPACHSCGSILHTGEGRVLFGMTLDEMEELAAATSNASTRKRLLCAIKLLDAARAERINEELLW